MQLAEAGFIFCGSTQEPDSVKCFFCLKSLDCWEEEDDPWAEHNKHSPHCTFAKMNKPEKAFTFSEFIDIRNELIKNVVDKLLEERFLNPVNEVFDEIMELSKCLK